MEAGMEAGIYVMALAIVIFTLHTRKGANIPLAYLWGVDAALVLFTLDKLVFDEGQDITHVLLAAAFTFFAAYVTHKRTRQPEASVEPLDGRSADPG